MSFHPDSNWACTESGIALFNIFIMTWSQTGFLSSYNVFNKVFVWRFSYMCFLFVSMQLRRFVGFECVISPHVWSFGFLNFIRVCYRFISNDF